MQLFFIFCIYCISDLVCFQTLAQLFLKALCSIRGSYFLENKNSPAIIYTSLATLITDCTVKCHNRCYCSINFLCRFFFITKCSCHCYPLVTSDNCHIGIKHYRVSKSKFFNGMLNLFILLVPPALIFYGDCTLPDLSP